MENIFSTLNDISEGYIFDKNFVKQEFDNTVTKMAKHGWSLNDFQVLDTYDLRAVIEMEFVYCTYKDLLPKGSSTIRYIVVDDNKAILVD